MATERGIEIQPINLRAVIKKGEWRISLPDDGESYVSVSGEKIQLDPDASYYNRIFDLSRSQSNPADAILWQSLTFSLYAWLAHIPGRVINRPGGHTDNYSKPLHEKFLMSCGLNVPGSLISSDREKLLDFVTSGPTVIKSVSSMRAYAKLIDKGELSEFNSGQGPIHLQRYIPGKDVRTHVIGQRIHSELIESDAVDYRTGKENLKFSLHLMPEGLSSKLINITSRMKLLLIGWDFKLDKDNNYWCLEANQSPGYDSFDCRLGHN